MSDFRPSIRIRDQGNPNTETYHELYAKADGMYVNDSAGNTVGPLVGTSNEGITQLTGDVTAGPGTGSQVAKIAVSPIVFNVKTYGAKGDGTTDDSSAIQSAINAAQTNGGAVYFPVGTYLVGTSPTVSTGNITLFGDGSDSIIKIKANTQANALLITGATDVQVWRLSINGNMANVDTTGQAYTTICGIRVYNSTNVLIEGCYATACYYGGIVLDTCTDAMVRNNRSFANRDNAIFLRPANTNVTIIGNHTSGSTFSGIQAIRSNYVNVIGNISYDNGPAPSTEGDGIGFEGCLYSQIVGNICYGNSTQGIKIDYTTEGGANQNSAHILVSDNHIYNNGIVDTESGIDVTRSDYVTVKNNYIYSNYYGINVGKVTKLQIQGNNIVNNSQQGIRQYDNTATGPVVITGNKIEGNSGHGIDNQVLSEIIGNVISGNSGEGIRMSGGNGWLVQGNIIFDNTDNGILVASGSNHDVKDNTFDNIAGTAQGRALYESAGPTRLTNNRIRNQSNQDYSLNNAGSVARFNDGTLKDENGGTASLTSGATTVNVNHGLATTPVRVLVSPTSDTLGKRWWVSAKGSTTFTITIDSSGGSNITFDWRAYTWDY